MCLKCSTPGLQSERSWVGVVFSGIWRVVELICGWQRSWVMDKGC